MVAGSNPSYALTLTIATRSIDESIFPDSNVSGNKLVNTLISSNKVKMIKFKIIIKQELPCDSTLDYSQWLTLKGYNPYKILVNYLLWQTDWRHESEKSIMCLKAIYK